MAQATDFLFRLIHFLPAVFLILAVQPALCLPGLNSDGSLDKETIKNMYFEGEFDRVREALEAYRKEARYSSTEDKVFMYKYLSVVYVASPETRDKGESYMYQLLKLVPTATLMDMYISDTIKAIFSKVRQDYEEREGIEKKIDEKKKPVNVDAAAHTAAPPPAKKQDAASKEKPKKSKKWIWWTAGVVGVAAAITVFILAGEGDEGIDEGTTVH